MNLQFDPKKLKHDIEQIDSSGLNFSISYNFNEPMPLSGSTTNELREEINRIGGFSSEIIDKETINLISQF